MKKYKVRFHLGRGKNYQMWQVTDNETKAKRYYNPDETSLTLLGCTLGNQVGVAKKIFDGQNKTVCAWVDCDRVIDNMSQPDSVGTMTQYKYNPRKNPHWFTDADDNVDKKDLRIMITKNRQMYG